MRIFTGKRDPHWQRVACNLSPSVFKICHDFDQVFFLGKVALVVEPSCHRVTIYNRSCLLSSVGKATFESAYYLWLQIIGKDSLADKLTMSGESGTRQDKCSCPNASDYRFRVIRLCLGLIFQSLAKCSQERDITSPGSTSMRF